MNWRLLVLLATGPYTQGGRLARKVFRTGSLGPQLAQVVKSQGQGQGQEAADLGLWGFYLLVGGLLVAVVLVIGLSYCCLLRGPLKKKEEENLL